MMSKPEILRTFLSGRVLVVVDDITAQDVIALAIENNIDIEIQRYGVPLGREVIRRAQGGYALRNVGVNIFPGPQSVSLAGISISGLGGGGAGYRFEICERLRER